MDDRLMIERPILMSGAMVRASLREVDPKGQTRRVILPQAPAGFQPQLMALGWFWVRSGELVQEHRPFRCPYGVPGDRLWVRETYSMQERILSLAKSPIYAADEAEVAANRHPDGSMPWKWTPAIHMRREHCRLVLEVTGVRVERLQDISEADAIAEGITTPAYPPGNAPLKYGFAYRLLWDSLNAARGYGWATNPFVWVVSFKRFDQTANMPPADARAVADAMDFGGSDFP